MKTVIALTLFVNIGCTFAGESKSSLVKLNSLENLGEDDRSMLRSALYNIEEAHKSNQRQVADVVERQELCAIQQMLKKNGIHKQEEEICAWVKSELAKSPFVLSSEVALVEISKWLCGITLVQKLVGDPFYVGLEGEVQRVLEEHGVRLSGSTDSEIFWKAVDSLRELEEQQRKEKIVRLEKFTHMAKAVSLSAHYSCFVNIKGLDPAAVIKALFDYARPARSKLNALKWAITEDDWRAYIDKNGMSCEVEGRVMCMMSNGSVNAGYYNSDNGELLAHKIVAELRAKQEN